jgi:hypothetical protein
VLYIRRIVGTDLRDIIITTRTSTMSTTSTAHVLQCRHTDDLTPLLTELEDRADCVLTRLYLLWQLDEEFAEIEKSLEQQDYINLIRSITGKMEADLEVIRQKNELLNNGQLSDWIDNGTDEAEKSRKQEHVMRLMKKMDGLQKQMAEAKRGYLG